MTSKKFSEVLVWMLRHNVIVQLFTHLMLVVPESFGQFVVEPAQEDVIKGAGKVRLSALEKEYIESITPEKTPLDLLFIRLCHYAHGHHHLDEIVWRENLTHQAVLDVLSDQKYGCLITVDHPLPALEFGVQ